MPNYTLIVATDSRGGIGLNGDLPWSSSRRMIAGRKPWAGAEQDMANFVLVTRGRVVVMGRKTFESLPDRGNGERYLPNRRIAVLTSNPLAINHTYIDEQTTVLAFKSFEDLAHYYRNEGEIIVAGGSAIYDALAKYCSRFIVTTANQYFECDSFWNAYPFLNPCSEHSDIQIKDGSIIEYRTEFETFGR